MKFAIALIMLGVGLICFYIGATSQSNTNPPTVTVCETHTQTSCIFVDGTAYWK